ncbi:MAG: TetR/AcrR family transcriptional regulator [Rhodobiaceae bacterium]|nr:TetR/AcrR family transcriptional regulator [Rhodobiaceae bacterium]
MGASDNLAVADQPSRRSRKKEQTRRSIFSAAMKLFADRDYDAVTIEDICERADVAKATFFLHFPNKAALLTEFNERLTADLQERVNHVTGSAEDKLRFMVSALVDDWEQNAEIMRKMVREFLDQPSLPEAATEANAGLLDLITDIVKEGQRAREFGNKVAPELVAAALVASWGSFVSAWSSNREDIPKSAGEDLLDIMLNGLKT